MADVKDATHKAVGEVADLARESAKRVLDEEANMNTLVEKTGNMSLVVSVLSLLLGIVVAWLITRTITHPLNHIRTTIAEIEKSGDLTRRVLNGSHDEVSPSTN